MQTIQYYLLGYPISKTKFLVICFKDYTLSNCKNIKLKFYHICNNIENRLKILMRIFQINS